jgi:hypothetical protein
MHVQCASAKTLENYEAVWKTVPDKASCFQDFNYAYDEHGVLRNTVNQDKVHSRVRARHMCLR